jgi:hypothetical protein
LGFVALREGSLAEEHQIFSETAQDFPKNNNVIGVVLALQGMSGLFTVTGKFEQAAQLIGWTDATREAIKNKRPVLEQADVVRDIATIVKKIGNTAFEEAFDSGRGMTIDEAVEFALSG